MFKHILVATDGSTASEHAAQMAVNLARAHGARLTALYVVDPYPYLGVGEANPYGFQAYMAAAQAQAAEAHTKVAELCKQGSPEVQMQATVVEDAAVTPSIVDTAKAQNADLIVVGSHGRTGIARLMLGSIASKVVAESPVPVLVVR
jgi:nucleotide-binding universal stress UspA family protein